LGQRIVVLWLKRLTTTWLFGTTRRSLETDYLYHGKWR
jgi:hypothetical protein